MDETMLGAMAFGYDWQNGFRGEIALNFFGDADVKAPCSSASDGSPCSTHADISDTSVKTRAFMANVYYSPLEAAGNNSRFQPFLTAGIGSARNEMSDWTRVNPASGRPVRVFEGDRNTDFAWSVGAGLAYEPDWGTSYPVILEATYRYFDLGTASGSSVPLPGNGFGEPIEPFQFENRAHVVSIGLRIPLQRY